MTEEKRKEIMNVADMLQGEINRMCVTDDFSEFLKMSEYAHKNLLRLYVLIRYAYFSDRKVEE